MKDPLTQWVEAHPSTMSYVAVVVTILLFLEIAELITTG